MRILLLNGSPKGDKSDTMHLSRAFLDGMSDVCHNDIDVVNVIDKNIGFCRGCFECKRNGGTCWQKDDMREIIEMILESDRLIFSFPLYGYAMPAHLKALLDRTMPLSAMSMKKVGDRYEHPANRDFSRLKYVMISGCGFPNSKNNFEAAQIQFKLSFGEEDSTIICVAQAPMFNAPEAVSVTKPFLEVMRQAGREYAKDGVISDETARKLKTPMIPEEVYAKICNGEA